jgi:hypothetical protein
MKADNIAAVTMRPYAVVPDSVETVPDLVAKFMSGDFREKLNDAEVLIIIEHEDTGQGMSYKNRLFVKQGESVIYDTGMITWRNGRGGYPIIDADHFRTAGLLRLNDALYLGIENGEGKIEIRSLPGKNIVARFDVAKARKCAENAKLHHDNLKDLRVHFRNLYNRGNQYPWKIGGADITCDLVTGFMAYHNRDAGRGGEVWNKFVVVIIHRGQPYISDAIRVSLSGDNWCLSHLTNRKVEGNKFTVGVACCNFKLTPNSPDYQVTFELCIEDAPVAP